MQRFRTGEPSLASAEPELELGTSERDAAALTAALPVKCRFRIDGGDVDPGGTGGRGTLAMRLPYNSPFFRAALPSCRYSGGGGGAPRPKDPRGTGTPPFSSNLAIRSRRAEPEPLPAGLLVVDDEADEVRGAEGDGDTTGDA